MVEINTKSRESIFIEIVIQQWCRKVGRQRVAKLICNMSLKLSRDERKRSGKEFQSTYESIQVDENNMFKINAPIMKAFFFCWREYGCTF